MVSGGGANRTPPPIRDKGKNTPEERLNKTDFYICLAIFNFETIHFNIFH